LVRVAAAVVGLYTLSSVGPELESAWFRPLNLKCDLLVSKVCFQMSQLVPLHSGGGGGSGALESSAAGKAKSSAVADAAAAAAGIDIAALSAGLPTGWRAFYDAGSQDVYYGEALCVYSFNCVSSLCV
jgi:hypothetical protein